MERDALIEGDRGPLGNGEGVTRTHGLRSLGPPLVCEETEGRGFSAALSPPESERSNPVEGGRGARYEPAVVTGMFEPDTEGKRVLLSCTWPETQLAGAAGWASSESGSESSFKSYSRGTGWVSTGKCLCAGRGELSGERGNVPLR